ncbi:MULTISPECIES: pentapeptide repeat-containing protein [unclassified Coleofasciculus]|uniref:pentapeptide repeat-containing protein n=1 Tax=unclassified Coleofasciculus TaxID=2692782 RepID=UPI001881E1E8|nr:MULTISPECIES: pentapeptide repeat-containing protein [unclassified Coleofasciculus]MBE9128084.1 pentapeptide repeat-containing protein [Coleofasciculus sp. LEGE 07081]MBE9146957.1 pentapeptide repeat-containing protein [Coleofasciculus sp. LEGE 07092]
MGANLSYESLRGMRLRGIDLSGSDLSLSDLRGTNFTDARLVGVDLCGAKTGTLRRWAIPKLMVASVFIAIPTLFAAMFWAVCAILIFDPNGSTEATKTVWGDITCGVSGLFVLMIFPLLIYRRGTLGSLGITTAIIANSGIIAIIIFVAYPGVSSNSDAPIVAYIVAYTALISGVYSFLAFLFTFPTIVASTIAVAVASTTALIFTSASLIVFALIFASVVAILLYIIDGSSAFTGAGIAAIIFAFAGAGIILSVSYLISCRTIRCDPRERLVFTVASWIVGLGGTQFKGADLTNADCSKATLKSAHFHHSTNLTHTRFHLAQKVNLARLDKTILSDFTVQNLLITLK